MIVPDGTLVLTLAPDNVSNATLTAEDGTVLYTVSTAHGDKTTTSVRNASDEVLATLEWRDVLPDRVAVGGAKQISMGDWMKRSMIPFKDDITFTDDQGRKYKWRGNSAGRSFELSCADDNYATVIARFERSRRVYPSSTVPANQDPSASVPSLAPTLVNPAWTPALLTLTPRAQQIQDTVVTSFLFLEKTRRTAETQSQVRADAVGTPLKPVGKSAMVNGGV
ncbi:hypothetical protein PsYK624_127390 [Phanerochaete sordida]|uniref:DUF6593 domain-containing protein n=1 Tax=Phanerochaete sordida TaxID=48140 RepID=A0A9P3GJW5_9APHY|nr:hypothetical protein PsYK624_127390 [Phanerochaete sordida]